jgi:hypothetical protein
MTTYTNGDLVLLSNEFEYDGTIDYQPWPLNTVALVIGVNESTFDVNEFKTELDTEVEVLASDGFCWTVTAQEIKEKLL